MAVVVVGVVAIGHGGRRSLVRRPVHCTAVAGVVEVDDAARPADERWFTLSNAHAHVLTGCA